MARPLDHKCKQCRREGEKLFLKGERCYTTKCPMVKRNYPPGLHGPKRQMKMSEFGTQMRAKQKVRRSYRILERQFQGIVQKARTQTGDTGEIILRALEMRFDNVVYRAGIGQSRDQARQLVHHAHFLVNGTPVNIPSYHVKPNDHITLKEGRLQDKYFEEVLKRIGKHEPPSWMTVNSKTLEITIVGVPEKEHLNQSFDMQLVVEYYSRR
jgi:small subunit ribosomal protein S4